MQSRAENRKAEKIEKDLERAGDNMNKRGYSTNQHIQIEMLELQKKRNMSRNRESLLIGESAMSRQIESIERRALRYDELGKEHKLWEQYESFMDRLQELMQKISAINNLGYSEQCSDNQSVRLEVTTNSNTVSSIISGVHSSSTNFEDLSGTP